MKMSQLKLKYSESLTKGCLESEVFTSAGILPYKEKVIKDLKPTETCAKMISNIWKFVNTAC